MTMQMRILRLSLIGVLMLMMCVNFSVRAQDVTETQLQPEKRINIDAYQLDSEDKIKITVFEEGQISDTYSIDGNGYVSIPLIGEVELSRLTLREAEMIITKKLADGYLVDPNVTIEIAAYRPFYIMGEVRAPGRYEYVHHISALKAVALAGGFTYRANRRRIEIVRGLDGASKKMPIDTPIHPGDIVTVQERFF